MTQNPLALNGKRKIKNMRLSVTFKGKKLGVVFDIVKLYYDNDSLVAVYSNGVIKFNINEIESFDVEEEIPELL